MPDQDAPPIQEPTKPAEPKKEEPAPGKEGQDPAPKKDGDGSQQQPPVVPEKYDIKLPEGSLLDASHVEMVSAFAKDKKLTNEEAQAVFDRDHANIAAYVEKQAAQMEEAKTKWMADTKSDKEIGGESYVKNVELAKRVVVRFGTDEFKKALNSTGLGNHPELVRVFVRIGKAMSEDQLVIPSGNARSGKRTAEEVLYGTTPNKEQ